MQNPLLVILAVLLLGALYVVLPVVASAYGKYRGVKRPLCPETGEPADVTLNLRHAVATAAVGRADVKVMSCSRWPERHGCDQNCVESIEAGSEL
jgi:hypothetical protein